MQNQFVLIKVRVIGGSSNRDYTVLKPVCGKQDTDLLLFLLVAWKYQYLLIFKRNDATNEVFEKMEKFINDFYVEPEKIKNKSSKDFLEDIVEEILAKIVGLMVKAWKLAQVFLIIVQIITAMDPIKKN